MEPVIELFRTECLRRMRESEERIVKCLHLLSDEQIRHRPNENVVSVGNLVLHLCGNIDQWINSTLGGSNDERTRDQEFAEKEPGTSVELTERIGATLQRAYRTIEALPGAAYQQMHHVQGFQETGLAILLHVAEHLSYHTGQITLHTKLLLNVDTGYYEGLNLNAKH